MHIEALLNYLLPIASAALAAITTKYLPKILNTKYYRLALQVLPIVDAVLADNTKAYGTSGVRIILQETIKSVADDRLSPEEISKVLGLVLKLFNPAKAASALPTEDTLKLLDEIARVEDIGRLNLGNIKFSATP
jgi:hypothetical protein